MQRRVRQAIHPIPRHVTVTREQYTSFLSYCHHQSEKLLPKYAHGGHTLPKALVSVSGRGDQPGGFPLTSPRLSSSPIKSPWSVECRNCPFQHGRTTLPFNHTRGHSPTSRGQALWRCSRSPGCWRRSRQRAPTRKSMKIQRRPSNGSRRRGHRWNAAWSICS